MIFTVQGVIIGAFGTLLGGILGVGAALTVSDLVDWLNDRFGLHLFDAYFVNYLPSQLRWQDVLLVLGVSLLLSFLATIYPARRAAQIQPAEALRYE